MLVLMINLPLEAFGDGVSVLQGISGILQQIR